MDTMKSLNTSLPRTPRRRQRSSRPSEQLLQGFKAAALSVTNLYRTAEANEHKAREEGYQAALEELVTFLDKENIGLCDGEGWRVRQWATEMYTDQPGFTANSDGEEESVGSSRSAGKASPTQHKPPTNTNHAQDSTPVNAHAASDKEQLPDTSIQDKLAQQTLGMFTFRAAQPLPQNPTAELPDITGIDVPNANNTATMHSPPSFRLNVVSKHGRGSGNSRYLSRSVTGRQLGSGTGSKRKSPVGDYFDFASSDEAGGGKRGRVGQ